MDASFSYHGLIRRLAPLAAGLIGFGIALGIATAPAATLDAAVDRLDLAALVPAAAPPVGVTGRSLLAIAIGGLVAALGWLGPLLRHGRFFAPRVVRGDGVAVRRADRHPDAPPRPPLRARDMMIASEPTPVARSEAAPEALPTVAEPVAATTIEPPVVRVVAPPVSPAEEPVATPAAGEQDIGRMLDRLERVSRRPRRAATTPAPVAAPPAPARLEDTLDQLRRLAIQ